MVIDLLEWLSNEAIEKMSDKELVEYAENKLRSMYRKELERLIEKYKPGIYTKLEYWTDKILTLIDSVKYTPDEDYTDIKKWIKFIDKKANGYKDKYICLKIFELNCENDWDSCLCKATLKLEVYELNKNIDDAVNLFIDKKLFINLLDYKKDKIVNRLKNYYSYYLWLFN